ncbi:hypothetical protein TNCV_4996451 [Trichonephila clavipes]|nr:hypothetical protein TNCV_4996451 [Trichonephila clavipes]
MSSAEYSSSPVHWSRWSPSILAGTQIGQASLVATPSQWRYTPKKSCPVVRRKRATASALSRCLEIGLLVASFPWLSKTLRFLGHGSIFVNVCGDNAPCSSEGQGDFRLSQFGSLLVFWVCSFIAGALEMTWDPL